MYFTEILILSQEGDLFLSEKYRDKDTYKIHDEIISRITNPHLTSLDPCFKSKRGDKVHYIQQGDVFVCGVSVGLSSVFVFDVLQRFCSLLRDFCGGVDSEVINNNIILVYDVLNEFMDNGIVQIDTTNKMKSLIINNNNNNKIKNNNDYNNNNLLSAFPVSDDILQKLGMDKPSKMIGGESSERSILKGSGVQADVKSELFVDVIEKLNVLISEDKVLKYEVDGKVVLRNHLTTPQRVKITFNQHLSDVFSGLSWHQWFGNVDTTLLRDRNVVEFCPDHGESTLLVYKTSPNIDLFNNNPTNTNNTINNTNKNNNTNNNTNKNNNTNNNNNMKKERICIHVDNKQSSKDAILNLSMRTHIGIESKLKWICVLANVTAPLCRIIPRITNKQFHEEFNIINNNNNNTSKNDNTDIERDKEKEIEREIERVSYQLEWRLKEISGSDDITTSFKFLDAGISPQQLPPSLSLPPSSPPPPSPSSQLPPSSSPPQPPSPSSQPPPSSVIIDSILLKYEISNDSLSGINITSLKISPSHTKDNNKNKPSRSWIRYVVVSDSHLIQYNSCLN